MKTLPRAGRVIQWGSRVAGLVILMIPPITQMDDHDNASTRYYFLPFLPKLFIGTFLWPVTVFLMAGEYLIVLLLALIAAQVVRRLEWKNKH